MATITEDYVSFETAKLLKEKGFPLPSINFKDWAFCMYDKNGDIQWGCYSSEWYVRVTLQMAMKWLREVHKLEIYPFHDAIQENNNWWYRVELHTKGCSVTEHESDVIYKTYEEACETAIKYCLEHLI